jgi:uncharacterized protein (DUF433 family)
MATGEPVMQIEDFFDFTDYEKHGEIRIQGHRIWMHNILFEYLRNGLTTPQQLLERFPSLDMPKVLACLLYYHTHEEAMGKMLADLLEWGRHMREKQRREHPEWHERLAKFREQQERPTQV